MKFTLPWLKEHLATDADAETIAVRLTALGLEVEDVSDATASLTGFTVAYVSATRPHPNAERLKLCTVETGAGVMEVVCGAPNARAGMKSVFAPEGTYIPGKDIVLKRATIRGVDSEGMLCSTMELGLGVEHDGIIELPADAEVGQPAAKALGIEGPVIDVAITPDRADCLGVAGVARDLAAAGVGRLRPRDFSPVPSVGAAGPAIRLDFPAGDEKACPVFVGRLIRGVRNGPSPAWLQERLKAIGLRPISALVDITNYVTFDLDRPLHVFDAAKLTGDLVLRFARDGETMAALDGKTYRLDPSITVIADGSGPVSLGGIMGGAATGVSGTTTDVVLEVALFDAARTGATGRRLAIESDARHRFERGLDPAMVLPGAEHATRLILELCGGEAAPAMVAGAVPEWRRSLTFRASALPRLAGIALEAPAIEHILGDLGFTLDGGPEQWTVVPPSWRADVYTEACIVEELARVTGFDTIAPVSLERADAVSATVLTADQRRRSAVRRAVAASGYAEAVTWSFLPAAMAAQFGAAEPILLQNPISSDLDAMRPSLLPNLLAAAGRNIARGERDGALFEVGPRFHGAQPGEHAVSVAGIRFGTVATRHWSAAERPADAFDAKADALAALVTAGLRPDQLTVTTDAPAWFHPGRSGRLGLGSNRLASFGEFHPRVLKAFDLDGVAVVGFELDLDALPKARAKVGRARSALEAWPFPAVDRDFAFLVASDLAADQLLKAVRGAEKQLIRDVTLFDVYAGKGLPDGKKSLALSVRLQARDRTLTEAEVEPVVKRIVAAAEKACGAVLRA